MSVGPFTQCWRRRARCEVATAGLDRHRDEISGSDEAVTTYLHGKLRRKSEPADRMLTGRSSNRVVVRLTGGLHCSPWSVDPHGSHILRASSTESPQPVHHWCTASTTYPHDVEAVRAAAALGCRGVSQTPTYDQLRGERINADVPASEADPHQVDHPGKHRLRDDAPAAAAVGGSSPVPGADLAEGWPWFGTREPARAGSANAPGSAHLLAATHRGGQAPAADQQAGCGQQPSEQVPRMLVPPPAHARDRQQHRRVVASRDAKADPLATMTLSELPEPHYDNQSSI